MRRMLTYLFGQSRRDKLPHLKRSLSEEYSPVDLESEIQLVLMTGLVRDPAAARQLMEKYQVSTAAELLEMLPTPHVDWQGRFRRWLQTLEGSYASDPHRDELKRTIGFDRLP